MAANAQAVLLDGALASMLELALAASNQSKSRSSNSLRGDPGGNRLQGVENKLAMSRNPSLYFLHRILEERRIEILMRSFLPEVLPLFVAINRRPALLEEEDDDGDDNDMREDEHYEQDEEQGEERDGYHKVERD
jgi:hypothetical protein